MEVFITLILLSITIFCAAEPIVDCPAGKIQGSILKTASSGKDILSFRGIPYAESPLGPLRFKEPKPKQKWSNTLDATQDGPSCPQPGNILYKDLDQSEDCLILNVYTKSLSGNAPVMFYIYPGAYFLGTSSSRYFGPGHLLEHDVVLVTFNYRLGVLGFGSTGTADAHGNFGLKDIILALKWVQTNIASFGGNPNSVMIFGSSAGAMATTLLYVSPMAKGLFHKALGLGAATNHFHHVDNPFWTNKMAKEVGCDTTNPTNTIDCLRMVPWQKLNDVQTKWETDQFIGMKFNFEIEKDFGQERVITKHPTEYYENGEFSKLPIMMGFTSSEFELNGYVAVNVPNYKPLLDEINNNFEGIAPKLFLYNPNLENVNQIGRTLKEKYMKNQPVTQDNYRSLGMIFSDSVINYGIKKTVNLVSKYSEIYYFVFDIENSFTYMFLSSMNPKIMSGVMHCDELQYVFTSDYFKEKVNATLMTSIFTQFAATGDPNPPNMNPKWLPTTASSFVLANISSCFDKEGDCQRFHTTDPYMYRYKIWDEFFPL